jgi:hypothetical protein
MRKRDSIKQVEKTKEKLPEQNPIKIRQNAKKK